MWNNSVKLFPIKTSGYGGNTVSGYFLVGNAIQRYFLSGALAALSLVTSYECLATCE